MKTIAPSGKILLVEDSAYWCGVLARYLQRDGHLVTLAQSYPEALGLLSKESFDIVLVDLWLGRQNTEEPQGMEILSYIDRLRRESGKESGIQTIVVTGYPTPEARREAVEDYGVADFFSKAELFPDSFAEAVREAAIKAHEVMEKIIASDELYSLNRQLHTHRSNLNELEEQKAQHGIDPPLHLVHSIKYQEAQISQKEARREELLQKLMK